MFKFSFFKKKEKNVLHVKNEQVNYGPIFQSIGKGKQLFEELRKKTHPDRFIGTEKENLALEIFQLVEANSTNYEELLKLKERIQKELFNG